MPTGLSKEGGNATIAVAAILPGQFGHVADKALFVFFAPWIVALCGAMLTKYATGAGVRKHSACHAPDQCNTYDARGLEVSPGGLR